MSHRRFVWLCPLTLWFPLAVLWAGHLMIAALLTAFRAMKHAGIAQAIQFDDVPILRHLDLNYTLYFWMNAAIGGVVVALVGAWCWLGRDEKSDRATSRSAAIGALAMSGFVVLAIFNGRYAENGQSAGVDVQPIGWFDAAMIGLAVLSWVLVPRLIESFAGDGPEAAPVVPRRGGALTGVCLAYVLGCVSVVTYASREHDKFWDPTKNGNYNYKPFFVEDRGELEQAQLVLYSTSVLFASVAAFTGALLLPVVRRMIGPRRSEGPQVAASDCRRTAMWLSLAWSSALSVPWLVKLLPEIKSEDAGWILPASAILLPMAALCPLIYLTAAAIKRDFDGCRAAERAPATPPWYPRVSEVAFFSFVLFPVYPVLRAARIAGGWALLGLMSACSTVAMAVMVWAANMAPKLYTFDDWRGMLRKAQFPFLQVAISVLAGIFAFLVLRRIAACVLWAIRRGKSESAAKYASWIAIPAKVIIVLAALANLSLATWPFWGWKKVNENVFARLIEFHDRHEFELRFLHWFFDFDRDGYAAVLHGADPDDFDYNVQAGGIPPVQDVKVRIDEWTLTDADKARRFPNLVVLYLEGVTPRSISAYGQRRLPAGIVATPHIDALAREGARFTQARCFYPSTWDAWYAVTSGRFLRIKEMDASKPFKDRYCRYSNLYKILLKAGINRYCHSDVNPFHELYVPYEMRDKPGMVWGWSPEGSKFDTSVSAEEEEREIWRGDKRNDRILKFIDSLKPGERFFITEHMSDTHFPWKRTSDKRARELGIPYSMRTLEYDAVLPRGGRDEKFSCYFQCITRMDAQIGQIVDKLKSKGLYDNTMIVIVSDHGCQWWEHEHLYYVSHLYDPAIRVPMIVKTPGLPKGIVCDEPVMQMDVMTTVAELAGMEHANPDPKYPMTARSLVPLLKGETDPSVLDRYRDRDILLKTHYDRLGILAKRFRYKLIFDRPSGSYRLFDLKKDPGETFNLADDEPELLQELVERMRKMLEIHPAFIGGVTGSDE